VEGKGPATIHGVTSSKLEMEESPDTSPALYKLSQDEEKAANALARCKKVAQSIDKYMEKLDVEHLDVSKLGEAMDVYDATQEKWDDKILQLLQKIKDIEKEKEAELDLLKEQGINEELRTQAVIELFAEGDAEIELFLIYGDYSFFSNPKMSTSPML
jgi:DNA repair ATPase RecN